MERYCFLNEIHRGEYNLETDFDVFLNKKKDFFKNIEELVPQKCE